MISGSSSPGGQDYGGTGNDLMMGGGGADVFVFATNDGTDTIGTLDIDYITPAYTTVTGPDFVPGVDQLMPWPLALRMARWPLRQSVMWTVSQPSRIRGK